MFVHTNGSYNTCNYSEINTLGVLEMDMEKYKPRYVELPKPITTLRRLSLLGLADMEELLVLEKEYGLPFPLLTSEYFVSLMDIKDPQDPLRQLVVPTKEELNAYYNMDVSQQKERGSFDTSGEHTNLKAPGLQHKYGSTALALISNVCAGLCRECFRKRIFFEESGAANEATFPNEKAIEYLKKHKEINTILLSGGDAFMLSDDSLLDLLDILADKTLDHITTIRFGSKIFAYYPQRVTQKLVTILKDYEQKTGKCIQISTHFEHANELGPECIKSLDLLHGAGLIVYNQTVLLNGINYDVDMLYNLFSKMAEHGVRPYYLFQCRPVIGSMHQQVPLVEGVKIYNKLMQRMSGVHKPLYAMSTKLGKMQIVGLHPENENIIVLRRHSSKKIEDTGKVLFYDVSKNDPYWVYT